MFGKEVSRGGEYQSLGLEPLTATLMTTSSGPGVGMGESMILTVGPGWTIASFMVEWCRGRILEGMFGRE